MKEKTEQQRLVLKLLLGWRKEASELCRCIR